MNAVKVASAIVEALPQAESPEATDERYGYYCPLEINGALLEVKLNLYLRDFDLPSLEKRINVVQALAKTMAAELAFRIIEMDSFQSRKTDGPFKVPEGFLIGLSASDIVSGCENMAGVDADTNVLGMFAVADDVPDFLKS